MITIVDFVHKQTLARKTLPLHDFNNLGHQEAASFHVTSFHKQQDLYVTISLSLIWQKLPKLSDEVTKKVHQNYQRF